MGTRGHQLLNGPESTLDASDPATRSKIERQVASAAALKMQISLWTSVAAPLGDEDTWTPFQTDYDCLKTQKYYWDQIFSAKCPKKMGAQCLALWRTHRVASNSYNRLADRPWYDGSWTV